MPRMNLSTVEQLLKTDTHLDIRVVSGDHALRYNGDTKVWEVSVWKRGRKLLLETESELIAVQYFADAIGTNG